MHLIGLRRVSWRALGAMCFALAAALILVPLVANADSARESVLVVATEKLDGSRWARTVMLARAFGDVHVGVILNRPTTATMAELFPDHPPSAKVTAPVHVGGTANEDALFALVPSDESPGPRSLELSPGIWLAFDGAVVDHIIETRPNEARYFVGMMVWKPGALAREKREGLVLTLPVDKTLLFLPDAGQLYDRVAPKKGQVGA